MEWNSPQEEANKSQTPQNEPLSYSNESVCQHVGKQPQQRTNKLFKMGKFTHVDSHLHKETNERGETVKKKCVN